MVTVSLWSHSMTCTIRSRMGGSTVYNVILVFPVTYENWSMEENGGQRAYIITQIFQRVGNFCAISAASCSFRKRRGLNVFILLHIEYRNIGDPGAPQHV